jgi:hypothetical protein
MLTNTRDCINRKSHSMSDRIRTKLKQNRQDVLGLKNC